MHYELLNNSAAIILFSACSTVLYIPSQLYIDTMYIWLLTDNTECQPDLRLKGHSKEG